MRLLILFALVLCVGCDGSAGTHPSRSSFTDPDGAEFECIGAGSSATFSITPSCVSCNVDGLEYAIDADLDTYAHVDIQYNTASPISLRTVPNEGDVFSSGSNAAVIAQFSSATSLEVMQDVSLRSYLGDELQEVFAIRKDGVATLRVFDFSSTGRKAYWFTTAKPFDSLELSIEPVIADQISVFLFEFCSDLLSSEAADNAEG